MNHDRSDGAVLDFNDHLAHGILTRFVHVEEFVDPWYENVSLVRRVDRYSVSANNYGAPAKSLYVVGRGFSLLLLNCSAGSRLAVA